MLQPRLTFHAGSVLFLALPCHVPAALPHVGVLVRNESEAPAAVIEKAQANCQQIFRAAGIRISWMNVVEDVNWSGPDLVVRAAILARPPVLRGIDVFGSAFPNKREGSLL
jgi:hypothetical protein